MTQRTYCRFKRSPKRPVWRLMPENRASLATDTRANFDTKEAKRENDGDLCTKGKGVGTQAENRRISSTDHPDWNLIIRVAADCDYRVRPINQALHLSHLWSRDTSRCIPICLDAPGIRLLYIVQEWTFPVRSHRPIVRLGVNDRVAIIRARS